MPQDAIFLPVTVLALLTFTVLLLVPIRRVGASRAGRVGPGDFRYGESARVPGDVSLPNRNYMNLLELPLLFYVLCVILFVTKRVDQAYLWLAWSYVGFRVLHSLVHLGYNDVLHRLAMFAASNVVLLIMWLRFLSAQL